MKKFIKLIYLSSLIYSFSFAGYNQQNFYRISILKSYSYAIDNVYTFFYSITPSGSDAEVGCSLSSASTLIDPNDYYFVELNNENKEVSITNLKACKYVCFLNLYSMLDSSINTSITLDYLKRVTGINAYCYESDDFITFNSLILYGVGTLSSSYSIENESLTFTDEFISLAKSILTPSESNVSIRSIAYYGFDGDQSKYLVSGYEIYDLVYEIYCTYKTVTYSPIGTAQYTSHTIRLSSYIDTDEYKDLFSGHYSLFDYIGYVNGVSYSKSLSLQLYQV